MWCSCPCTHHCDDNLKSSSLISHEMGSFPVLHGLLSLSSGNMGGGGGGVGYPGSMVGLQRSATCGYLPSHQFYPMKDDFNDQATIINGRLTITDGKLDDDDDVLNAKLSAHNGKNGESRHHEDGGKKTRDYSDDCLTPDSTLPAVIRRRNRNRRKKLATSMVENTTPSGSGWESETSKPPPRNRSHSVSDDQWAQVMADQTTTTTNTSITAPSTPGPICPPGHTPADMSAFAGMTPRRNYNTMTTAGRGGTLGRGMVSSASVCDLNSLAQQQQQQQQQQQNFCNSHAANSFQQLNMMGYPGGVMWGAPCELCQVPPMFPNTPGMKRTASNLSMNLSSVGSDMTGYPWAPPPPPHVHHHMPMYPGYYPGYHPHIGMPPMGAPMGLNMSIPDSMHTFSKVPSSPAPSVRSTSHRSHKSSKSRSFSAADNSGRRSRNRKSKRSEESEESRSSSVSEDMDDIGDRNTKSGLAWQCDHCTFINNGGARTCGMCSKTIGGGNNSGRTSRRGSERRRSDRRRDRRTDHEDNERDGSEYDNDDGGVVKSNLSFNIKDNKSESRTMGSNKGKSKKKSRRRGSSASDTGSGSEEEEERLEKRMKDLRVSSSSRRRGSDYEGITSKEKIKDKEKSSRKREGSGRFKNRGRSHSERARTPGRQTPLRASPADDMRSLDSSSEPDTREDSDSPYPNNLTGERESHQTSADTTVVDTLASEVTLKTDKQSKADHSNSKSKSKSSKDSSPALSAADDDDDEPQQEPQEIIIEDKQELIKEKSRSPSPKLRVGKSKSPPLSQRTSKGEADDPSFANTLDDVATMGTNEVADQDLGSHYVDEAAPPVDVVHEEVPVVNFVRSPTPDEDVIEDPKTLILEAPLPMTKVEPLIVDKKDDTNIMIAKQSTPVQVEVVPPEPVYEPSYEPIEGPKNVAATNAVATVPPKAAPTLIKVEEMQIHESENPEEGDYQYQTAPQGTEAEVPPDDEKVEEVEAAEDTSPEPKVVVVPGLPLEIRGGEVARSASSGSSLGFNSSPRERQYTPLSFSSSDAQFYSPPDSPDISLSEQLQDKPGQTVRPVEDDYLVTAMETMQQMTEDIKSSRETIRSSMDQLPYSEEVSGCLDWDEWQQYPPQRSPSKHAMYTRGGGRGSPMRSRSAEPPNTNTNAVNNSDNYDSLCFQDALTPSNAADLPPTVITQTPASPHNTEDLTHISANVDALINEVVVMAERQNRVLKWGEEDQNEKFLTVEEIITKRRQEAMRKQGLQLVQILRDAEEAGYTSEDVSIALTHCGDKNPLEWLKENWRHMVDTVSTLATNYGQERRVNDVGSITAAEARVALRIHKGNIWAAVTECVEQRQKKFSEIYARGKFRREEVIRALEANDGDTDKAFLQLNRFQLQPFLNKIWQPQQVLGHLAKLWHPHQAGEQQQQQQQQQKQPPTTTNQKQPTATASPPQPEPQRDTASQPQQPPVPLTTTAALSQAPRPTAPIPAMAVPTPLLPTPTTQMVQGFEYVTTSSDEDDIFENTYANIEPLNKQPSKVEPVYATVIKKSKRENKETTDTKGLQMVDQKPEQQTQDMWAQLEQSKARRPIPLRAPQERTPSPDGLDLSAIEDEALFSASEVVGLESEEGRSQLTTSLKTCGKYGI
ncbi:hypothetical protein Pmani_005642 [Petrolisthes manimaculis]|uniref:RanBP2-type domain-containing protein n=1 Tax=Petrolisthes manimaculis TaxID=1843537 RepID=A0AAE1QB92_9EUCA|nr:hypothetical protein Pmani_005642 [Petrolisthes manimaculis]